MAQSRRDHRAAKQMLTEPSASLETMTICKVGVQGTTEVLDSKHIGARQRVLMEIVFNLTDEEYELWKSSVVQGDAMMGVIRDKAKI